MKDARRRALPVLPLVGRLPRVAAWLGALAALSLLWAGAAPVSAAPALPSRYEPWPPQIVVTAPIPGVYVLIEHGARGDTVITHAELEAGWVARFPIVIADGRTPYHVQVSEWEADEALTIRETPRYTGIWKVYLAGVGQ